MTVEVVAADIVDAAGQCASVEQFAGRVLAEVRRVAPCESALFLPASANERVVALDRKPTLVGHYRQNVDRYQSELARERAVGLRFGAYVDVDIYSFDERQRLAFYNEIIRPQRVACRIVAYLSFRGQPLATLHLCAPSRGGARQHALDGVRRLIPTISLAYAATRSNAGVVIADGLGELTSHQRRIAKYVSLGYQNKEIAALLQLSPHTVRNELVVIFKRTRVLNRAQLAALIARTRD